MQPSDYEENNKQVENRLRSKSSNNQVTKTSGAYLDALRDTTQADQNDTSRDDQDEETKDYSTSTRKMTDDILVKRDQEKRNNQTQGDDDLLDNLSA